MFLFLHQILFFISYVGECRHTDKQVTGHQLEMGLCNMTFHTRKRCGDLIGNQMTGEIAEVFKRCTVQI